MRPLAAAAAPKETYVAVLSVDGLGAAELFTKPSCVPPNGAIRALAGRGAISRGVTSVLPAITYPAHATMVTGLNPDRHGLVDNGLGGEWFKKRSDIGSATLWDAARKAGTSVAIVTWPSTYGAEADYLVPEDLANQAVATAAIRKGSTPPDLFDSLAAAAGEPALLPFADPDAGRPLDDMTARFAAEVVKRHRPRLLLAHFLDYDHRMHLGPYSPEACAALARIDAHIARIREAYQAAGIAGRTTFFIVADHGFLEVKQQVSIHGLLKAAGWEAAPDAFALKAAGGSVAFYPGPSLPADAADRLAKVRARIEREHAQSVEWITPAKAKSLGGFPGALFVLCARPGYSFALLAPSSPKLFLDSFTYRGAHGYCPTEPAMNAAFIASGYCVRHAGAVPGMALTDLAPTIGAFLGVRLPQAQGRDRSARFRAPRC